VIINLLDDQWPPSSCAHILAHIYPAGCTKSAELLAYVHDKVGEIHTRVLPVMEDLV